MVEIPVKFESQLKDYGVAICMEVITNSAEKVGEWIVGESKDVMEY